MLCVIKCAAPVTAASVHMCALTSEMLHPYKCYKTRIFFLMHNVISVTVRLAYMDDNDQDPCTWYPSGNNSRGIQRHR